MEKEHKKPGLRYYNKDEFKEGVCIYCNEKSEEIFINSGKCFPCEVYDNIPYSMRKYLIENIKTGIESNTYHFVLTGDNFT